MDGWITVIDIFRELRREPIPEETWAAGARVREAWAAENGGDLPIKDNRPKTNGGGSHCFALYPPSWRPKIIEIVSHLATQKENQGDLFAGIE